MAIRKASPERWRTRAEGRGTGVWLFATGSGLGTGGTVGGSSQEGGGEVAGAGTAPSGGGEVGMLFALGSDGGATTGLPVIAGTGGNEGSRPRGALPSLGREAKFAVAPLPARDIDGELPAPFVVSVLSGVERFEGASIPRPAASWKALGFVRG